MDNNCPNCQRLAEERDSLQKLERINRALGHALKGFEELQAAVL
jgi:hypothetical protein